MRRLMSLPRLATPFLRSQRGALSLVSAARGAGGGATAFGDGLVQRGLQLQGEHAGLQLAGVEITDTAGEGATLSGSLGGSSWRRCALAGTTWAAVDAAGATWDAVDLKGSSWSGGHAPHARLSHCSLREATLDGLDLSGAVLVLCDLSGARLSNCNLAGARLVGCDLTGARLQGCDLSGADLGASTLRDCSLVDCTLDGVVARGVDAGGLSGVTDAQRQLLADAGARARASLLYSLWARMLGGGASAEGHRRTRVAVALTWAVLSTAVPLAFFARAALNPIDPDLHPGFVGNYEDEEPQDEQPPPDAEGEPQPDEQPAPE